MPEPAKQAAKLQEKSLTITSAAKRGMSAKPVEDWLIMLNALSNDEMLPPQSPARKPRATLVLSLPDLSQTVNSAMPCGMAKGVRCFINARLCLYGSLLICS